MISPTGGENKLKEKIFAALILVFFLVIYYNAVVIRGHTFMTTMERSYQLGLYHDSGIFSTHSAHFPTIDPAAANQINLPTTYLEHHYLKTFQLPLWNPYSGLGRPYSADMNSYSFFLPIYLFKFFPSLFMYDLFMLFRLFIAGFFLFLLLRSFKCPFWGAVAGASFYMFNSYFHAYINMDQINVTMWLSPLLYFLTRFLFSMDKRYLLGFALCSAGSFYGGNPNEFILIHLFVTIYFVFIIFIKNNLDLKRKFRFLSYYLMSLVLAVFLSSVKLVPFLEFWKHSYSSRAGGLTGTTVFLPFKKFLGWVLLPNQMFIGPNYAGFLILSLMLYAIFNLIRKRWQLREKIVAFHFIALFLFISKINAAPYINWIGTLPLLRDIHFVKYSSLIYFMISVISAFSLIYIVEDVKKTRIKIVRLFLFLFCLFLPHLLLWIILKDTLFKTAAKSEILSGLFVLFTVISIFLIMVKKTYMSRIWIHLGMVTLMLLAIIEFRVNNPQRYRKRFKLDDKAPYTQFLLKQKPPYRAIGLNRTLSPNHNLIYPIPTINRMYAIRITRSTVLLFKLVNIKFDSGMPHSYYKEDILNNPYLDLLNVKYYVSEAILDSIVINPEYARSRKIKDLMDNPSMQYVHHGNLYYYPHRGWKQLADSSVDIPVRLPFGDVYLKSTSLAYSFDGKKRDNSENKLRLIISVKQGNKEEVLYRRTFIDRRGKDQDFFNLKVDLSTYAGKDVILNFRLSNPGAKDKDDRSFFFGDLRIIYNKITKSFPSNVDGQKPLSSEELEIVPYEEVFSHHALVYRNNSALDRGFVLYRVRQTKDINDATDIMKNDPLLYKHTALIEGNLPQDMKIGKVGQSQISFLDYRANDIKAEIKSTEDGVFVLSDTYYPGWKAYLDKKRVKIYPAFGALRAVFLPKGKHELHFCYRPWTFYLGVALTAVSLIFIVFLFFKIKTLKENFPSKKGNHPLL